MFNLNICHFWMWTFFFIRASLGVSEGALVCINEVTMTGPIEGWFECSSLGTSKWSADWIKEETLPGLKDGNKEDDTIWTTVGSPEINCDGIKEDNSDGNTEAFTVGKPDDAKIGLCDSTELGVTDYSKLGE